jgi:hypothetical protein
LPADSVGNAQIKNGAVGNSKLASNSVGFREIIPGTIGIARIKPNTGMSAPYLAVSSSAGVSPHITVTCTLAASPLSGYTQTRSATFDLSANPTTTTSTTTTPATTPTTNTTTTTTS